MAYLGKEKGGSWRIVQQVSMKRAMRMPKKLPSAAEKNITKDVGGEGEWSF